MAKKANSIVVCISNTAARKIRDTIVPLYSALHLEVSLHLEYSVQHWAPQYKNNVELLTHVQRRATKLVKGVKNKSYGEMLKEMGLFSLKETEIRLCQSLQQPCKEVAVKSVSNYFLGEQVIGNLSLCQGMFYLVIMKNFFHGESGQAQSGMGCPGK